MPTITYPTYQIASDGNYWQILEITLGKKGENEGKPVKRPISYPSNLEHAAKLLREKCVAAKCYTPDQKLTVEKILEAVSESNAIIQAAVENAVFNQTK